jgi:hypothetical protein
MGSIINITIPTVAAFAFGKPLKVGREETSLPNADEALGKPALTNLSFRSNNQIYTINDCIMTVNQERNIVETGLQGRNGTVKQYISDGDFGINVQASLTNDYLLSTEGLFESFDGYPLDELKLFIKNVLKVNTALEVTSDWLDLFGIRSVVIKSYDFEQETYSNRQTFTMQMLSDEPFEIKLLK